MRCLLSRRAGFGALPLPALVWKHTKLQCAGDDDDGSSGLPAKPWPDFAPPRFAPISSTGKFVEKHQEFGIPCLICNMTPCDCHKRARDYLKDAYEGKYDVLYDDALTGQQLPWFRTYQKEEGSQRLTYVYCWLCHQNLTAKDMVGKSKLCREGLALGQIQKGQLPDHAKFVKLKKGQHYLAWERYTAKCTAYKARHWGEIATQGQKQPIVESMEQMRLKAEEERMNHVHAVYLAAWQKQSAAEYVEQCHANLMYGAKLYGALYANETFFGKVVKCWSRHIFKQTWSKIEASPVLIVCTDEADGDLGIRVQLLEKQAKTVVAASYFLMVRRLADYSAKGIFRSLLATFTQPSARPEELKNLVMTEDEFAKKTSALVGDGASVNGLNERDGNSLNIKVPIEVAKPGENLFWHFSEFRKQYYPINPIGVWCHPHKADLMADAVTNKEQRLPTFFALAAFLKGFCNHVEHSGKQQADLNFLNELMIDERIRTGSLRISPKTWVSNVNALKEVLQGMGIIHMHLKHVIKKPRDAAQRTHAEKMLRTITSVKVYMVMAAYLDMQKRLKTLNTFFDTDRLNINDVHCEIERFKLWVHDFALRDRHEGAGGGQNGQSAKVTDLVLKWDKQEIPEEADSKASSFQNALRRLKHVEVEGGLCEVRYSSKDKHNVERVIPMQCHFVKEITVTGGEYAEAAKFLPDGEANGKQKFKAQGHAAVIFQDAKDLKWRLSQTGKPEDYKYIQKHATTYLSTSEFQHKSNGSQITVTVSL
jgi:hypothetical protein